MVRDGRLCEHPGTRTNQQAPSLSGGRLANLTKKIPNQGIRIKGAGQISAATLMSFLAL